MSGLPSHGLPVPDPGWLHMTGDFSVRIAVQHFPVDLVRTWLPGELELAPQTIAPDGFHPCNLLHGIESRVYFNLNPLFKLKYHEFGLVLPYVQWKDKRFPYNGPFLFTPIIFVDSCIVSFGGDVVFGFPKRMAEFHVTAERYSCADPQVHLPYVEARYKPIGTKPNGAGREAICDCLQQPSVSQKKNGSFLGSGFFWGLSNARFDDIEIDGQMTQYLLPGVANGQHPYQARGTSDVRSGAAYHLQTRWTLTLPTATLERDWSPWNGTASARCSASE